MDKAPLDVLYNSDGPHGLGGAEEELKIAADLVANFSDPFPIMAAEIGTDRRFIYANDAFCSLFGLKKQEVIGAPLDEVFDDAALTESAPRVKAAFDGHQIDYDLDLSKKLGRPKFLNVTYSPEWKDGVVTNIIITVTDITERLMLERTADQLEARLKAAHLLSPDGFMVFEACRDENGNIDDFRFEYTNTVGAQIADRSPSEMIGKRLLDVLPGNKEEGLFDAYVRVVEDGDTYETEVRYEHDGLDLWLEISAIKIGDGFAVSFSDISDRKNDQLLLQQQADRLQRILDNVIAFVGTLNVQGRLKNVNQPALDVAGLEREDVLGKYFWDTYWWNFSPEVQEKLQAAVDKAVAGTSSRYDTFVKVKDDQKIMIDFQINPVTDDLGNIVELIVSGTDISERYHAEEHRDLLINELNHRVKNSLATIQAMARQTIKASVDLDDFGEKFSARLQAISAAHDILTQSDQGRASLHEMILRQTGPYATLESGQLVISGPDLMMCAESAHAIGLVLHELSTNASKYGALSIPEGVVFIKWGLDKDGHIDILWEEKDGPSVQPPKRKGFGSQLIKQSLEYSLNGKAVLDYPETGFRAQLILPREKQDA